MSNMKEEKNMEYLTKEEKTIEKMKKCIVPAVITTIIGVVLQILTSHGMDIPDPVAYLMIGMMGINILMAVYTGAFFCTLKLAFSPFKVLHPFLAVWIFFLLLAVVWYSLLFFPAAQFAYTWMKCR